MRKTKFLFSLILAVSMLMIQTGGVFAISALQTSPSLKGAIQSITLETYSTTGMTVAIVTVMDSNDVFQTVRVNEKTALDLGLVMFDSDGRLIINDSALGKSVEIEPEMILSDQEEDRHPVGNALATFFSNIEGLNYNTIMNAYNDGTRFGVIAQALWLTTKLEGNAEVFQALLLARETDNYEDFTVNGTIPKNWAELRKAILDGKKVDNLGSVMSNQDHGNANNPDPSQDKENNQDKNKEKDKEKDKNKDNGGKNKEKNK